MDSGIRIYSHWLRINGLVLKFFQKLQAMTNKWRRLERTMNKMWYNNNQDKDNSSSKLVYNVNILPLLIE